MYVASKKEVETKIDFSTFQYYIVTGLKVIFCNLFPPLSPRVLCLVFVSLHPPLKSLKSLKTTLVFQFLSS